MQGIKERIANQQDFWAGKDLGRPLIAFQTGGFKVTSAYSGLNSSGLLLADELNPKDLLPDYRRLVSLAHELDDDAVRGMSPLNAIPWLEAIIGCPVQVSEGNIWAEGINAGIVKASRLRFDKTSPWFQKYLDFIAILVEEADDRTPVGLPILRGVSDLASIVRGNTQIVLDCFDNPKQVKKILAAMCALTEEVWDASYKLLPRFFDGSVLERFSLWTPGPVIRIQNDEAALYSPELYQEFFLPLDIRLAVRTPYTVYHLHSGSIFLLEVILKNKYLDVIEIDIDTAGPNLHDLIPAFRLVQSMGRLLIVRGEFSEDDTRLLRREVSTKGLMIIPVVDSLLQARDWLRYLPKDWSIR